MSDNSIYEHWKFEISVNSLSLESELCSFEGHSDWARTAYSITGETSGFHKTTIDPVSLTEAKSESIRGKIEVKLVAVEEPRPNIEKVNVFFPGKTHAPNDPFIRGRCCILGELFIAPQKDSWKLELELDPKIFKKIEKACDLYITNNRSHLVFRFTVGSHEVQKKNKRTGNLEKLVSRPILFVETANSREEGWGIFK